MLLDLPAVAVGSVGVRFCGGLLSDPPLSQRGRPGGEAGRGPAAGQLLVVLVVHVQQLPWTDGDKQNQVRTDATSDTPLWLRPPTSDLHSVCVCVCDAVSMVIDTSLIINPTLATLLDISVFTAAAGASPPVSRSLSLLYVNNFKM